jgi:pentapeptide repeat protein
MKRSVMTIPGRQKATTTDTVVTRTDVVRLLQQGRNPATLDVSGQDLRGINLVNFNVRWADLSQARVCEANLCGTNLTKVDLHGADLRGTFLDRVDVRGADLSWASFGGPSSYEQAKNKLWYRGAIFRETTDVKVAVRITGEANRYLPGFSLGFLLMSVVGLVCVLGLRVKLTTIRRLKRPSSDGALYQVGTGKCPTK